MCGIFAYLGLQYSDEQLKEFSNKIQHRGPDNTIHKRINPFLFFSFHRLAINGLNEVSNQPFSMNGYHLICNGEIFNYKELIEKYNLQDKYISNSDCEIILHLIPLIGIEQTCKELDGEFAFIFYDENKNQFMIARDQLGIRSLFWCSKNMNFHSERVEEDNLEIMISSEAKSLIHTGLKIEQFPVASYFNSKEEGIKRFYTFESEKLTEDSEEQIIQNIKTKFEKAVQKRLLSDRSIGCLLSGGLDSSVVTALVAKGLDSKQQLNTYSIGMKGSTDNKYAKIVAEYIGSVHHVFEPTEEEFLNGIEETIIQIESYDTTSVRASVGNYMISKYIREYSNDVVIFCGDVSDEIFASYRGFGLTNNDNAFYEENVKMLHNIQYFDVLRSDKTISGAGLEARVPFADPDFIKYVMSIPPKYKKFTSSSANVMEKYLFRKAFDGILPEEVIWRKKEAFSDGVSSTERSWFQIIKEYMDNIYSDKEFEKKRQRYTYNQPYDKESLYYRELFEKHYPNQEHLIPYFWRHPFSTQLDPSARLLSNY
jgi:asparagine synthase (glutamine-hydrolysing)